MLRRTRFFREVHGANFQQHSTQKKHPKRTPFIVDERPPSILSLEWIQWMTLFRWCFYAGAVYSFVDFSRFILYRLAPGTTPVQPSPNSYVASSGVALVTPCVRYPGRNLVLTEAHVENDTAAYMPAHASTSLQHDMPHHQPRRTLMDRAREVRAFFGYVADKIAGSLVIINIASPHVSSDASPPRDGENAAPATAVVAVAAKKRQQKELLGPFLFDAPPSQWPSHDEQQEAARLLAEQQQKRLQVNDEDVWGRRGVSKKASLASRPNSMPGFVSWSNARFDRPSSPDWTLPKHLEDTSENTSIDPNSPVQRTEGRPKPTSVDELPRRLGDGASLAEVRRQREQTASSSNKKAADVTSSASSEKQQQQQPSSGTVLTSSNSSGTAVTHNDQNAINEKQHRFMSFHFERSHHDSGSTHVPVPPTEIMVKCTDASATGTIASRCTVDNSVLCAHRHRSMLAALALLPDPLPPHLQIATFGAGPTAIAAFLFKYFSQHMKRLDVITEPALVESTGIVDFGLTSRSGPVTITDQEDEQFMLRTDKKYDLMFLSTADPLTGQRGGASLSLEYMQLVRKTLSSIGAVAIDMKGDDHLSLNVVRSVFGERNCFVFRVPKSQDVVVLAGYSLPEGGGVHKRHIVHRAEDISYAFRLPYDLGAALPINWLAW